MRLAVPERTMDEKCAVAACRSCAATGLRSVLNLGRMPLSDGFLTPDDLWAEEPAYPLEVAFCERCGLVQILETVPPEELFCRDYPYYSSVTQALLDHSRENALELVERRLLGPESLVVELASNDGYMLRNFVERGIPVLGVDPAEGPARKAEQIGVPTLVTFFGLELAKRLAADGTRADIVIANNVLAHVADTNGFVEGIRTVLAADGIAVLEVPYVRDLVDHGEFDTIYHEHLCYFSVTALDRLFSRHGLFLNEVRRLGIHGGSLRLYVERVERREESVRRLLREEAAAGIADGSCLEDFGRRVGQTCDTLRKLLVSLKAEGRRIAAYGAAAKGTILLNAARIGREVVEFVVDRNPVKHGRFVPGVRIPIHPPERLMVERPDFVLLLPWNFRDEILAQQAAYRRAGGKFVIPIPRLEIV